VRAKVSEGIAASSPAKLAVTEYLQSEGYFPPYRTTAGFVTVDTKYVNSVTTISGLALPTGIANFAYISVGIDTAATGIDSVNGTPVLNAFYVVLTGRNATGAVDWTCQGSSAAATAGGIGGSALAVGLRRLLPSSCR